MIDFVVWDLSHLALTLAHNGSHGLRDEQLGLVVVSDIDILTWVDFLEQLIDLLAKVGKVGGVLRNSRSDSLELLLVLAAKFRDVSAPDLVEIL